MFWDKKKYIVKIKGSGAQKNTIKMRGMAEHLIVEPDSDDTIWSLKIIDKEGDVIFDKRNHSGRLDDKDGLPIGKDDSEILTMNFYKVSKNEDIKIIFRIREMN